MARTISTAALAFAAALATTAPASAQHRNPSLYSVNQPVVQRTDYVIDLGSSGSGIRDHDLYRLNEWFETLNVRYGDRIYVDTGGYGDERARQDVAGVAAEHGVLISRGAPVTEGGVQPGSVRVVVSRSEATVPGCPNWSDRGMVGDRITTSPNYGCSINSNLAAMIADPNDLVLGQAGSDRGDEAGSKAVKMYRERQPTGVGGLKEASSKGGN